MITYADVDGTQIHRTANLALSTLHGLGKPGPRRDSVDRSRAHGATDFSRYYNARVLDLVGSAKADTVAALHDVMDDLTQLFALNGGDHVLRFQREGRTFMERVTFRDGSELDYTLAGSRRRLPWSISLVCSDPRIYSDVLTHAEYDPTAAASSSGLTFPLTFPLDFGEPAGNWLTIVNDGNFPTPAVWTIDGPGRGMAIVNSETGEQITVDADLSATDFLVIDVAGKSCRLNGTTERPDLIKSSSTTWWEIPAGTTHARLTGSNFSAGVSKLEVDYRAARI